MFFSWFQGKFAGPPIAGTPILIPGSHSGIEVWEWYGSRVSHYWGFVEKCLQSGKSTWIRFQSSVHWLKFCRKISRVYTVFLGKHTSSPFLGIIPIKNGLGLPGVGSPPRWNQGVLARRLKVPRWSEAWLSARMVSSEILRKRGEVEGSGFLKNLAQILEKFR